MGLERPFFSLLGACFGFCLFVGVFVLPTPTGTRHYIRQRTERNRNDDILIAAPTNTRPGIGKRVEKNKNESNIRVNACKDCKCMKQIQIWTGNQHWDDGAEIACPGLECGLRQVEDTSFDTMATSDAVFLHELTPWDWDEIMRHKRPGQKWIMGSWESPINSRTYITPPKKYYNESYDYIMTYRRHEGNIYGDFGKFDRSKPSISLDDSRNWAEGKNRLVTWVASSCNFNNIYLRWNRTGFIRLLSKHLQVDMYGRCGDEECPRYNKSCIQNMEDHKFYLAFENCKCRDYITEKVWVNAFERKLVPIVYGPSKEDYERVLPPNSFIYLEDFKSISELAKYILLLDERDDLYNKFHEWRKEGRAYATPAHLMRGGLCKVVERLLEDERAIAAGTYRPIPPPDWDAWWRGSCEDINEFPIAID